MLSCCGSTVGKYIQESFAICSVCILCSSMEFLMKAYLFASRSSLIQRYSFQYRWEYLRRNYEEVACNGKGNVCRRHFINRDSEWFDGFLLNKETTRKALNEILNMAVQRAWRNRFWRVIKWLRNKLDTMWIYWIKQYLTNNSAPSFGPYQTSET